MGFRDFHEMFTTAALNNKNRIKGLGLGFGNKESKKTGENSTTNQSGVHVKISNLLLVG